MGTEIERKFLVDESRWERPATGGRMIQGYLSSDPACSVRVRLEGDDARLNIKSATLGIELRSLDMASVGQQFRRGQARKLHVPLPHRNLLILSLALSLASQIGASRVHESLRDGFDIEWYGEFADDARGLASTFRPTVTGAGAFYDNLEGWVEGSIFRGVPLLVGVGVAYALVWALFLSEGSFRHSIDQATRELLFMPVAEELRIKAKAFIDMFVQRFAKALAVGVSLGVTAWFQDFTSVRWLSSSAKRVSDGRSCPYELTFWPSSVSSR